jgi:hypothetical protein
VQRYESDLTDKEWLVIKPHLPQFVGHRPEATMLDQREVVSAVMYEPFVRGQSANFSEKRALSSISGTQERTAAAA